MVPPVWGTCSKNLAGAGCVRTRSTQSLGINPPKAPKTHLRVHSSAPKTGSSSEFFHPLAGSTGKTRLKLIACQTRQERITAAYGRLESLEDLDTQSTR